CLSAAWSWYFRYPDVRPQVIPSSLSSLPGMFATHWGFVVLAFTLIVPAWLLTSIWRRIVGRKLPLGTWLGATFLLTFAGLGTGWVLSFTAVNPIWHSTLMYVTFSVPAILGAMMLGGTLMAGLTSRLTTDMDEEWWARCGAYLSIACLVWIG